MKSHVVLATSLNLRTAPHVDNTAILAALPLGTMVEELDANADRSWLRVRLGALEGWMNNRYLLRTDAYHACPWLPIAVGEFGVAEVAGIENNPRIQTYLATVIGGEVADETAWCSAFAKWCVLQARAANPKIPDLKKITASARSWHSNQWSTDVTATAPLGSMVVCGAGVRQMRKAQRKQTAAAQPNRCKTKATAGILVFWLHRSNPAIHKST